MVLLSNLPPELLDHILSYSCVSHKVINLWKCGNGRLNTLLSNGGCTRVLLKDEKWNSTSRWPKMLRFLRQLKSLAISRQHYRLMDACELGKELQQLSPSLEELSLECAEAESCFLAFDAASRLEISEQAELNYQGESASFETPLFTPKIWPVVEHFPILKSLVLKASTSSFPISGLGSLPTSLVRLGLVTSDYSHVELTALAIALPRTLQSFTGFGKHYCRWPLDAFRNFPPTLTEFVLPQFQFEPIVSSDIFSVLPRTLTSIPGTRAELSTELMQNVPPSLTDLCIFEPRLRAPQSAKYYDACFASLPPHLTTLKIVLSSSRSFASHLVNLPRTITNLVLPMINWTLNSPSPQFPPRLKELEINDCLDWSEAHMKMLPQNGLLERLQLYRGCAIEKHFLTALPLNLKVLELSGKSLVWDPSNESLDICPTLTKLMLDSESTRSGLASVDPAIIPLLPRGLVRLEMELKYPITTEHHNKWPPDLRTLDLGFSSRFGQNTDSETLMTLPSTLKTLYLRNVDFMWLKRHLERLPRGLEQLCIEQVPVDTHLEGDDSETCSVEEGWELDGAILSGLPPSLTCLVWRGAAQHLFSSHCFEFLPATLKTLVLNMSSFELDYLTKLPPRLRSFTGWCQQPITSITLDELRSRTFPEHLKEFLFQSTAVRVDLNDLWESRTEEIDEAFATPDPRVTRLLHKSDDC